MRALLRSLLLLVVLVPALGQATAGRAVHRFYGYAFDQSSGRYLYTEVHRHVYQDDRWVNGTIRYYGADGLLIGQKTLDFSQDPFVPLFRLSLPGEGYEEGISAVAPEGIEIDTLKRGQRERLRLDRVPEMVADSGFHSFVVQHLDALRLGQTVTLDFIAVGRMQVFRFRLDKVAETVVDGHPALQIRAEPDSLLRLLAPRLLLTYDLQTHYLLEYRGISNLHDPVTGKGLMVRLVYPAHPPAGAPTTLPPLDAADLP
jgi:hypothetical protein